MRREELFELTIMDIQSREGVKHFRVKGKSGNIRYIAHPLAQRFIEHYLQLTGHGNDAVGPLFRPVRNNRTGEIERPLDQIQSIETSSGSMGRRQA
jgi:integrase/recombinase XerD